MPVLPVDATALLKALDPNLRLDSWSDDEIRQEAGQALKVCVQAFHQPQLPPVRQDEGDSFRKLETLETLGYRTDEISPQHVDGLYTEAVGAAIASYVNFRKTYQRPKQVMVGLKLPHGIAMKLLSGVPVPNRERPEDLHVTLAYIGEMDTDFDQKAKMIQLLTSLGSHSFPIGGNISGWGRFNASYFSNWMDVLYATYDSPDLINFRDRILYILRLCGVEAKTDHGFTAHVTLAYVPPESDTPKINIPDTFLEFSDVSLHIGDEVHRIALSGRSDPTDWVPQLQVVPLRDDARTWTDDPTVEGGGFLREQRQAQPDPPQRRHTSPRLPPVQFVSEDTLSAFNLNPSRMQESSPLQNSRDIIFFVDNEETGQEAVYKEPKVFHPKDVGQVTAEVVASYLGRTSGVPINDVQLVPAATQNKFKVKGEVGGTLHEIVPGSPVESGTRPMGGSGSPFNIQLGLVSVSEEMADRYIDNSLSNPDLARIAAYDLFISNQDRHVDNLFKDPTDDARIYGMDQGMAFRGQPLTNKGYVEDVQAGFSRLMERTGSLEQATSEQRENFKTYRDTLNRLIEDHPYKRVVGQMMQTTKASLSSAKLTPLPRPDLLSDIDDRVSFFKQHYEEVVAFRDRMNKVKI